VVILIYLKSVIEAANLAQIKDRINVTNAIMVIEETKPQINAKILMNA
jgi:hypothetical protein